MKDKKTEKQMYDNTRANLLLMIIFTIINIVLFFLGTETVMLFSATVPYMSILVGVLSEIDIVMQVCAALTTVIMVMYILCWIFSKRSPVWIIIATVMFVIDTLALIGIYLFMQDASGILDLLIHIWVLYYLFNGIKYGYKLRKMDDGIKVTDEGADKPAEEDGNTPALYMADMDIKYRVLAETEMPGYHVCYRRVKRTNELVINNYVYDAVEMLIEPPHKLTASINGHLFEVGNDGLHSYIYIDRELSVKKIRIW